MEAIFSTKTFLIAVDRVFSVKAFIGFRQLASTGNKVPVVVSDHLFTMTVSLETFCLRRDFFLPVPVRIVVNFAFIGRELT